MFLSVVKSQQLIPRRLARPGPHHPPRVRDRDRQRDAAGHQERVRVVGRARPLDELLVALRADLRKRGSRTIAGIGRKFRICDDNGSGTLNRAEFAKGMRELGAGFGDDEVHALFAMFDRNGTDSVDFEEFVRVARGELSARRRHLVAMAYAVLDQDGSGAVDIHDIVRAYDAGVHPDVIAGKKTPQEVGGRARRARGRLDTLGWVGS